MGKTRPASTKAASGAGKGAASAPKPAAKGVVVETGWEVARVFPEGSAFFPERVGQLHPDKVAAYEAMQSLGDAMDFSGGAQYTVRPVGDVDKAPTTATAAQPAPKAGKGGGKGNATPAADPKAEAQQIEADVQGAVSAHLEHSKVAGTIGVTVDALHMVPWAGLNPRRHFAPAKIVEMCLSMLKVGDDGQPIWIVQPLVLQPVGTEHAALARESAAIYGLPFPADHLVAAGETRWRSAALLAMLVADRKRPAVEQFTTTLKRGCVLQKLLEEVGPVLLARAEEEKIELASLPVPVVLRNMSRATALSLAMVENMGGRSALTDLEQGTGFAGLAKEGLSTRQIAAGLGVSQSYVQFRVTLAKDLPAKVQDVVDAGLMPPTQARDVLLPFLRLPVGVTLLEKAAAWYAKKLKDPGTSRVEDYDLRNWCEDYVRTHSRPLSLTTASGEVPPAFPLELHDAAPGGCSCGGPVFKRAYGADARRCFDPKWWDAAQAEARQAKQRELELRVQAIQAASAPAAAPAAPPPEAGKATKKAARKAQAAPVPAQQELLVLTLEEFKAAYGPNGGVLVGTGDCASPVPFLDPSVVDVASLRWVTYQGALGPVVQLYSVNRDNLAAATAAATAKAEPLIEPRRQELVAAFRAALKDRALDPQRPAAWALLFAKQGSLYSAGSYLLPIAKLLGIEYPSMEQVLAAGKDEGKKVDLLARGFLYCLRENFNPASDPAPTQIQQELRKDYAPLWAALVQAAGGVPKLGGQVESLVLALQSAEELAHQGGAEPASWSEQAPTADLEQRLDAVEKAAVALRDAVPASRTMMTDATETESTLAGVAEARSALAAYREREATAAGMVTRLRAAIVGVQTRGLTLADDTAAAVELSAALGDALTYKGDRAWRFPDLEAALEDAEIARAELGSEQQAAEQVAA